MGERPKGYEGAGHAGRVSTLTFNQTKFNQIFTLKVTLREAQRLNSTPTCSVVVPGCPGNFVLTGHTPPSRKSFLEEVVNDRGKISIEFNVNVSLNLPGRQRLLRYLVESRNPACRRATGD